MTLTMYGIPNCDTIKKARGWLGERGTAHDFHDYRKNGLDPALLARWIDALGWEALLNRAGTTFRKLPEDARQGLDRDRALALMIDQPAMIRRPVLTDGNMIEVGFKPDRYAAMFA